MVEYNNTSQWYDTPMNEWYLDMINVRPINSEKDDSLFTITPEFNWRPDLLAYRLYGDSKLWWVFIQRNLNILRDPIFDFTTGTKIYLPRSEKLFQLLGV